MDSAKITVSRHKPGQQVYVGDGIKVGKEGRKMPGVKGLHQESKDVSKPKWIRGHYFSALGLLLSAEKAIFAAFIVLKLHDGILRSWMPTMAKIGQSQVHEN